MRGHDGDGRGGFARPDHLLKVVNETAKTPESLAFSEFDEPVDATPPAGDVMDIDELTG